MATGQIKNCGGKASTYFIHVKFVDAAGNGVGEGVATVGKVDAGARAAEPTETARLAVFLVSADPDYVAGAT